jgi:hypothetical protein
MSEELVVKHMLESRIGGTDFSSAVSCEDYSVGIGAVKTLLRAKVQ